MFEAGSRCADASHGDGPVGFARRFIRSTHVWDAVCIHSSRYLWKASFIFIRKLCEYSDLDQLELRVFPSNISGDGKLSVGVQMAVWWCRIGRKEAIKTEHEQYFSH